MLALGSTRADFRVTRASRRGGNNTDSDTEGSLVNGFEQRGIDRSKIRRAHSSRTRSGRGSVENLSRPSSVLGCPERSKDSAVNNNNNIDSSNESPVSFRRSQSFNTKVLPTSVTSNHQVSTGLHPNGNTTNSTNVNVTDTVSLKQDPAPKKTVVSACIDSKKSKKPSSFGGFHKKEDVTRAAPSTRSRSSTDGKVSGIYGSVPRGIYSRNQDTLQTNPPTDGYVRRSNSFRNNETPVNETPANQNNGGEDTMRRSNSLKVGSRSVSMDRRSYRMPLQTHFDQDLNNLKTEKDIEPKRTYNLVRGCSVDSRSRKHKEDSAARERRKYLIHAKSDKRPNDICKPTYSSDAKTRHKTQNEEEEPITEGRKSSSRSRSRSSRSSERQKSRERTERNRLKSMERRERRERSPRNDRSPRRRDGSPKQNSSRLRNDVISPSWEMSLRGEGSARSEMSPKRREVSPRNERSPRKERSPRDEKSQRNEKSLRKERSPRNEKSSRNDRSPRSEMSPTRETRNDTSPNGRENSPRHQVSRLRSGAFREAGPQKPNEDSNLRNEKGPNESSPRRQKGISYEIRFKDEPDTSPTSDDSPRYERSTRSEFRDSATCGADRDKAMISQQVSGLESRMESKMDSGAAFSTHGIRRTSSLRVKELQKYRNTAESPMTVNPVGPPMRRVNSVKLRGGVQTPDPTSMGMMSGMRRYSSRGSINKIESEIPSNQMNYDSQDDDATSDRRRLSNGAHGHDSDMSYNIPPHVSSNVSSNMSDISSHHFNAQFTDPCASDSDSKPVIMPRRRRKLPQRPQHESSVLPIASPTPSQMSSMSMGYAGDLSSGEMSDCDSRTSYEASSSGFYPSDGDISTDSVEEVRQNSSTAGTTNNTRAELTPSPGVMRKSYPPQAKPTQPEKSPTTRRRAPQPPGSTGSLSGSLSRQSSISDTCTTDNTPPSSPLPNRRHGNRDDNVFSRLTSQTKVESPVADRGSIKPVSRLTKSSPLVHTHTASGHTRAVLSVFATDEMLFSSSKDRTGKMWDLNTGQELLTLSGHPNNVVAIRYSEETRLVYTVSTYYVKVWDTRSGNKCVKTLTSSGMTSDGALTSATTSRQVTCPPGETNINDIAINSTGSVLYSAAGSTVRIWDLRGFKPVGKLSGGHQAAIMVLAVDDTDTAEGNICVVTGSKDHYIKVFEMDEDSTGVMTPKCNLEPPHYDGIQSLCLMGDLLFSGSRDMCIKKWNLAEQQLAQSINNAHKDWVCGLSFMPGGNCLLSGCRGGVVKLWHIDTCNVVGEVKAHSSPINAVATNSCLIFTASNDRTVKFWHPGAGLEGADSSDE